MNKFIIILALSLFLFSCKQTPKFAYPQIDQQVTVDEYHGQKIEDPYRNLEDLEDSTVIDWFKVQNQYTNQLLNHIPNRQQLFEKLQSFDKEKPFKLKKIRVANDGHYFYLKKMALDSVYRLYYKTSYDDVEDHLLFDSSKYKEYKDHIINHIRPSHDNGKVVIGLCKKGEEISILRIIDVTTKKVLPQIITQVDPGMGKGVQWLPDNSGFTYQYFPITDIRNDNFYLNTATAYYKLGDATNQRKVLFSKANNPTIEIRPKDFPIVEIIPDNHKYIFGKISGVNSFEDTYYGLLENIKNGSDIQWKPLFTKADKIEQFTVKNDSIIFLSSKTTTNNKVCKTSLLNPDFENPEVLVQEKKGINITDFEYLEDGLFYTTLKNGVEARFYQNNQGKDVEIPLPAPSGRSYVYSRKGILYVTSSGWTRPMSWYTYNPKSKTFKDAKPKTNEDYDDFQNIEVKTIEVQSHDGAMVPLSLIHKKNLKLNKKNRTLLIGYGAYGGVFSPYFSPNLLTWVNMGGILAITHVRGGGEKGDAWHKAGYKATKPNTWKDAIACTQYLIDKGYTSNQHTAIYGVSAGGIMVGGAITERPDLYKVAVGIVPFINATRLEFMPNGANNTKELGTIKDFIEFKALYAMDTYHKIKDDKVYPATLMTAGYNDQRVAAWQSGKFIARLQNVKKLKNPALLSVDFDGGHGVNNSNEKYNQEMADVFSFTLWQTGHPDYQPKN